MKTLQQELTEIQEYLEQVMDNDIELVVERGAMLQVYLARSGFLLAQAKFSLNAARTSEIMQILKETAKLNNVGSTATNELIKASCKDEQYLVDWVERINKTCTHQLDFLRSVLSKAKEEMRYNYHNFNKNT